ncbi:MAG: toll/interleukin-1 receptor domain-containing protein, partial [Candidatus Rokubacteria bacterium]|nr:toll/interleukin-1 receptor domain-containing protein [Candidatus Rokubacteria bacterium]
MSRILISYRREDSAGHAGRLYDFLAQRFGQDRVFMDVDTISPGDDFVEVIRSAVRSSTVVIVLIGREWLTVQHPGGHRRLDDPEDFVALEVATALEGGTRVIPVLVQGAAMPSAAELGPRLAPLARRNAIEISDTRFRRDAEALIHSLERVLGEGSGPRVRRAAGIAGAGVALLAAAGVALYAWTRPGPPPAVDLSAPVTTRPAVEVGA